MLSLAWAPLMWAPTSTQDATGHSGGDVCRRLFVAGLTLLATLGHVLPLGLDLKPHGSAGWWVVLAMGAMYVALVVLQRWPESRPPGDVGATRAFT